MKSKITPTRWWRDFAAECDVYEGIVSREKQGNTTIIRFADGRVTYDDGYSVMTFGPPRQINGESLRTFSHGVWIGPHTVNTR